MSDDSPVPLTLQQAVNLADQHFKAGRLDAAAEILRRVLAAAPEQPVALNNLGHVALAQGRLDEAHSLVSRAVTAAPQQPEFHNTLGNIQLAKDLIEGAEASFLRTLELQPLHAKALGNLVHRCRPAAAHLGLLRYLAADPGDRIGARAMISLLGFSPAPPRASDAHLTWIYGQRAANWDANNSIHAPRLVADALNTRLIDGAAVLDAGCGTGLVGERIRAKAGRLDGVDLSADMLAVCKAKGLYDGLFQEDLVRFAHARPDSYDAIACAATLIHFGALSEPLSALLYALRPGGLLVMTLFPDEEDADGYRVAALDDGVQGGLFRHGRNYIERTAAEAGFVDVTIGDEVHEEVRGRPRPGLVVVCRRPGVGDVAAA